MVFLETFFAFFQKVLYLGNSMVPESTNIMDPPAEPCSPHERRANPDDTKQPETAGDATRPTHRLKGVKCGENGAQLMLSTRDHTYDLDDVVAGNGTWQVVGAWSDESAPELTKMLSQRISVGSSTQSATRPQASAQPHFDGAGKRLGAVAEQLGSASN